jgi:hypothetical protein
MSNACEYHDGVMHVVCNKDAEYLVTFHPIGAQKIVCFGAVENYLANLIHGSQITIKFLHPWEMR